MEQLRCSMVARSPKKSRNAASSLTLLYPLGVFMRFVLSLCLVVCACSSARAQNLYTDTLVRELRLSFSQPNWQQLLKDNVVSETDIPVSLSVDGVRYDSVGIRYKGNSSYNIPGDKKPFNISMDAFREDQLLMGYKTLNLNNCFKDPTYCREKIAYELAARYLPAAKAAYVKLYINDVYWGLYLNVQQLNGTFLREWFGSSSGNNYKCDPRGDLQWMGADTAQYKKNYEKKTNEDIADWSDLVSFIDKLNNLPAQNFQTEIEKVLDVDRALWYIAFCNVLVNLDSYIGSAHNYYLYNNPVDKRFSMIPWDMNEVLGVFQIGMNVPQLEQLPLNYGMQRPLVRRLLAIPEYSQRYAAHMRTLVEEALDEKFWSERITAHQNLIRTAVESDSKKLYSMAMFNLNVDSNVTLQGPGGLTIPGVLRFIRNRKSYLQTTPEIQHSVQNALTVLHEPIQPTSTDSVLVRAMLSTIAPARLWYSIASSAFKSVEMHDLIMGAIWVGAYIPAAAPGSLVRFYVEVADSSKAVHYSPEHAEHITESYVVHTVQRSFPVVINELMASNQSAVQDPQGQFEDWIELYNTADSAVDLSGLYLTDDNNSRRWSIPQGTMMPAMSYLLVWADEDTTDVPGVHANFKLSKSGEAVLLYDTEAHNNVLLDSVSFGAQSDNISYGRIPNGSGPFVPLQPSSPGAINLILSDVVSEHSKSVSLYPNPVHETMWLTTSEAQTEPSATTTLYDALGQRIPSSLYSMTRASTGEGSRGTHVQHLMIHVHALAPGVYYLQCGAQHYSFIKY